MKRWFKSVLVLGSVLLLATACTPDASMQGQSSMWGQKETVKNTTKTVGNVLPGPAYEVLPMFSTFNPNKPKRGMSRDVKRAIRSTGFPIYKGTTPPSLDGYYDVLGTIDIVNNIAYLGPGLQIPSQMSLYGRNGTLITMVEHYYAFPGQVNITGKNGNFTLYMKVNYFNNTSVGSIQICDLEVLISGTKTNTGIQSTLLRVDDPNCRNRAWVTINQDWTLLGPPQQQTVPQ